MTNNALHDPDGDADHRIEDQKIEDREIEDREIELKLEIDSDAIDRVAASAALAGVAPKIVDHVSVYYDTPRQELRKAGVSLRVRATGGRHVQTIKAGGGTAAGLFARQEWECDVARGEPELDAGSPIRTLLPGDMLEAIAPAFTVAIRRRQWTLDRDGGTVELVADTGVVTAGDRTTPVSEIELELKGGAPAAIFALVRGLGRDLPLRLGVLTKGERGYRLIGPARPGAAKAERLELPQDTSAAQAFAQIVAACLRHFRLNEAILLHAPDAGALHQARVALRRLRSALSIFRPILSDARFAHLAADLKWLAGMLGAARDLDVLIARLGGMAGAPLVAAHAAAYTAAQDALESDRARHLMIDLIEWTALGDWRHRPMDPDAVVQPAILFAGDVLDRLSRRLHRRGRHLDRLEDAARHRVRIATKKLRYAVGFFESLYTGKKARRRIKAFSKPLEKLQDRLGALNDIATAPALLRRLGIDPPATATPADRADLLRHAARARKRLRDAARFW